MPKIKTVLKVIIAAIIIGFIMSFLIHSQLWNLLIVSLSNFNIFLYLLLPLLFFSLVIFVHELSHLISFVVSKIKIRAIFVLIFGLYKNKDRKWRFIVVPKNIKMLGGFVVPDLPVINSDQGYDDVKNKFAKALLAGPIGSLIYAVLIIIIFILTWFLTNNLFWIAFNFLNMIVTILITVLVFISSKLSSDQFYGDFVAYKKFETDQVFHMSQIDQYIGFSLNETKDTYEYLYNKITNYYINLATAQYTVFDYSLLQTQISLNLDKDILDLRLDFLIDKYDPFYLSRAKGGLELAFLISAYYYKKGNVEKAYVLFNHIKGAKNKHYTTEDQQLIIKEYEHFINLANNEQYFINSREQIKKNFELFLPIIDIDEIIKEKQRKLPFVNYYTILEKKEEPIE